MITKSASFLAKQYQLEHYLDKPSELNDLIFKLMLLQETMQLEKARKVKSEHPDVTTISVQRAVIGKIVAACKGDGKYGYAVETALEASTATLAVFQRSRFMSLLRSLGVPEDKIIEYCETITIDDDTHCIDHD